MKTAGLAIQGFRTAFEAAVKESGLPPVILELLVGNYYAQLRELAKEQIRQEEHEQEENADGDGKD